VAEGVTAGRLGYTGFKQCPLDSLLHHARIDVVSPLNTRFLVVT
jgi:hypothetical protein